MTGLQTEQDKKSKTEFTTFLSRYITEMYVPVFQDEKKNEKVLELIDNFKEALNEFNKEDKNGT